jgi:hypothetical protein
MSVLGKLLVLIIAAFSLICCLFGVGIYTYSINWGWQEKFNRSEFGTKVASELKKRQDAIKELGEGRKRAEAGWLPARTLMVNTEANIARDQLNFVEEMERVRKGPDLTVAQLAKKKPWLMEKQKRTGKALFEGDIGKSYDSLVGEVNGVRKQMAKVRKDIQGVLDEETTLTEELIGKKDEAGKRQKGLYALVILEQEVQRRATEELGDLKPLYYQELVDSQTLLHRQESLQFRLRQLENVEVSKRRP